MYGYADDEALLGIIVLNEIQDPLYQTAQWKIATNRNLVIHRLCVDPFYQNRGVAKQLVLFAEKFAKQKNYDSIRLDAFTKNKAALKLYEGLGYSLISSIDLRKGEFFLFEKGTTVMQG